METGVFFISFFLFFFLSFFLYIFHRENCETGSGGGEWEQWCSNIFRENKTEAVASPAAPLRLPWVRSDALMNILKRGEARPAVCGPLFPAAGKSVTQKQWVDLGFISSVL